MKVESLREKHAITEIWKRNGKFLQQDQLNDTAE